MSRRLPLVVGGFSLLAALAALSAPGRAQAPPRGTATSLDPRYVGEYRYAETMERARARIRHAAEPVLSGMNPVVRLLAERAVDDAEVPRRIRIALPRPRIAITYVGREDAKTFESRAGYPTDVHHDGRSSRMTQLFRDGHLEQIFQGERGRWYNVFELGGDGAQLTMSITIVGERLPRPVRLTLPYRRAP